MSSENDSFSDDVNPGEGTRQCDRTNFPDSAVLLSGGTSELINLTEIERSESVWILVRPSIWDCRKIHENGMFVDGMAFEEPNELEPDIS
jgi:hypothetical protein